MTNNKQKVNANASNGLVSQMQIHYYIFLFKQTVFLCLH